MAIECHFKWCPHHECHNDPESGPFCCATDETGYVTCIAPEEFLPVYLELRLRELSLVECYRCGSCGSPTDSKGNCLSFKEILELNEFVEWNHAIETACCFREWGD